MLKALRARTGWRRALALALVFAFTAGLMHVHGSASVVSEAAVAIVSHGDGDGHDHGHGQGPSVTSQCAFCAVVAGKFYLPSQEPANASVASAVIAFQTPPVSSVSALPSDLFRPPIARSV